MSHGRRRADSRAHLTSQFEANLAREAARRELGDGRALFIGDSHTELWGAPSTAGYWSQSGSIIPDSSNVGVSGATCWDVRSWLPDALAQLRPTLVVVTCGVIDLNPPTSLKPQKSFEDFDVVYRLVAESGARLLLWAEAALQREARRRTHRPLPRARQTTRRTTRRTAPRPSRAPLQRCTSKVRRGSPMRPTRPRRSGRWYRRDHASHKYLGEVDIVSQRGGLDDGGHFSRAGRHSISARLT